MPDNVRIREVPAGSVPQVSGTLDFGQWIEHSQAVLTLGDSGL
jgi:hypothetical protein